MGIHTSLYNYFINHATSLAPPPPHLTKGVSTPTLLPRGSSTALPPGHEVYDRLDAYFADVAREVFLGAPLDDSALVHYLVPCFIRYSTGAQSINRLLNYLNRQYVKRAVDEDKGWLRFGDIVSSELAEGRGPGSRGAVAGDKGPGRTDSDAHKRIAEKMRERRVAELRRWGAPDGGTAEQEEVALAEACAEAASAAECVVPVLSLAYKRFRMEVLEPLLAVPKLKSEGKKKKKAARGRASPAAAVKPADISFVKADKADMGPRGRLARSMKEFLESKGGDEEERNRFACEMADMLMRAGVRPEHPLRRRLGKHCKSAT
jgi:hypothetical protein